MARRLNRRHNSEATHHLLRAAVRLARMTTNRVKEEHWLAWCASLDNTTPVSLLWRKIRSVGRGSVSRPALHPRPQEEAERLAVLFASRSATARLPPAVRLQQRRLNPERWLAYHQACLMPHPADAAITLQEVRRAIPDRSTSPGDDRVSYGMLRHAGPTMEAELLHLFNASYTSRTVPTAWKSATIVPIPKAGAVAEYRPISLLSCIGKTMERVLLSRLEWSLGPLHHHLFAFCRGKGTRDCVTTLLSGIVGCKAVAVFLDITKAFEMASTPAILSVLAAKGVRGRLLSWVGQYLQGRTAAVRFQGTTSASRGFENGTPQGGILSPLLFNLLMERLVGLQGNGHVRVLSYADDIVIVASGPYHVARARVMLRRVLSSCSELGLAPNPAKTRAVAFGYKLPPAPLFMDDTPVPWVHQVPYLGMLLDSRLSFKPCVASVRVKMMARARVMRAMAGSTCGAGDRVLRSFYVGAVRSCLDYAAPCLITLPASSLAPLETAQNSALRTLLGAPGWTKCLCMRAEASLCCVSERVRQLGLGHLVALLRTTGAAPLAERVRRQLQPNPPRFRRQPWQSRIAQVIHSNGLAGMLTAPLDLPVPAYVLPPPWTPRSFDLLVRPLSTKKALLSAADLRREAIERVAGPLPPRAVVYFTDGSVNHQSGAVGAAFVGGGATGAFRLTDGCSSTQAELAAISMALLHAEEMTAGPVVVHSDSRTALQAINQASARDNVRLLTSIWRTLAALEADGRRTTLNWLPSHAGVEGNEAADTAAKDATLLPLVTVHLPPSLGQLRTHLLSRAGSSIVQEIERAVAVESPSGCWYAAATDLGRWRLAISHPRSVSVPLHRLRLGFKCLSELDPDDIRWRECEHCEEEQDCPLLHYLLECPLTRPLAANPDGLSAPALLFRLGEAVLTQLVKRYLPPR
ncbi:uncharacterized protein LOC127002559 [Eriocheir sinensis]|uniref:uncharacterized protein LOC127002559 n=1 Tax=Eriocheir sinensis TaxID=95602 RepID=UPI0021C72A15|nr:uncharacterized protein LOC127002559 [Eriocheir sinensis]